MTNKKQVRKLFAVVALATATPAVAGPEHAHRHAETKPVAADPWNAPAAPATATTAPVPSAIAQAILALFGISVPRTLPTGAPACGNLGAKSQARADCERARR